MKKKSYLKYLFYIVLIGGAVFLKGHIEGIFQKQVEDSFKPEVYMPIFSALVTQMIGVAMGLEFYFKQSRIEGRWKVNLPRLLVLGLPSLYLSSIYVIAFIPRTSILYQPIYELFGSVSFISIFQILFGFILITSFTKEEPRRSRVINVENEDYELENVEEFGMDLDINMDADMEAGAEFFCN